MADTTRTKTLHLGEPAKSVPLPEQAPGDQSGPPDPQAQESQAIPPDRPTAPRRKPLFGT
jgi:hypothetical protein